MKRSFITFLCFLCSSIISAQYVAIPDANFANWLQTNYPSAMSGNQLDTTNSLIVNATSVVCTTQSIQNLEGIHFFDNLETLNCSANPLVNLPLLPSSLKNLNCANCSLTILPTLPLGMNNYLYCYGNQLTSLPTLPNGIKTLSCSNNLLSSLPTLPDSLVALYCKRNMITSLPLLPIPLHTLNCDSNLLTSLPIMPAGLKVLYCSSNQITSLPSLISTLLQELRCNYNQLSTLPILPPTTTQIWCSNNLITSLPVLPISVTTLFCPQNLLSTLSGLPDSIHFLYCQNNQLTSIAAFPIGMTSFYGDSNILSTLPPIPDTTFHISCINNQITSLPSFLNTRLTQLYCAHNQLSTLSAIPSTIVILDCSYNQLTSLSTVPSAPNNNLYKLYCQNNPNISCLPKLKPYMNVLKVDSTAVSCLPNVFTLSNPTASTPGILSYPICDVPSGCNMYWNITGNIHSDTSSNCLSDSLFPGARINNVKVKLYKNGNLLEQVVSNTGGHYSFDTGSSDTLDVKIDTTDFPFIVSCPITSSRHVVLNPLDSMSENTNFGLKCNGVDMGVKSIYGRFRPATLFKIRIKAGDMYHNYGIDCNMNSGGTVTTTLNGPISFVNAAPGALYPTSIIGNTLVYNVADFGILNPDSAFNIIILTDTFATAGTQVCIQTVISNVLNDVKPSNDTLSMCFNIVNSFDPNLKEVYPLVCDAGEWLTYTIQFQNTGNDTAYLVVIKDTLSSLFDISSFAFLESSHNVITQLKSQHLTFTFPNINLLDSVNHEPESHGWVQFKIKLKDNLPHGTAIENKASIYFDYNSPIVTNTATTSIGWATSLTDNQQLKNVVIAPNPANESLQVYHIPDDIQVLKIFSVEGALIKKLFVKNENEIVDISKLSAGLYFLTLESNNTHSAITRKFVVER